MRVFRYEATDTWHIIAEKQWGKTDGKMLALLIRFNCESQKYDRTPPTSARILGSRRFKMVDFNKEKHFKKLCEKCKDVHILKVKAARASQKIEAKRISKIERSQYDGKIVR